MGQKYVGMVDPPDMVYWYTLLSWKILISAVMEIGRIKEST